MTAEDRLDPRFFRREDEAPDVEFYREPRLTVHIDDDAIAAVTRLYRELLPAGGAILDLMSSWRSHLPPEVRYARVVGLGMNAEEMADNPQLDEFVVHDLNADPRLPFPDESFDGCCVTVSVQYLTRPVAVFREVNRVLRPGAPFVVTYSNRCFPTKAVAIWRATTDTEHAQLIAVYFHLSGGWGEVVAQDRSPARAFATDPLYAVWARKVATAGGAASATGAGG
jgi:SAM-dependent methyltransferase